MKAKLNITELFFQLKGKNQQASFDRGLCSLGIHRELKPVFAPATVPVKNDTIKSGKI